jgi:hypothetical protein
VERRLTQQLADALRARLGPSAADVERQAADTPLDALVVHAQRGTATSGR